MISCRLCNSSINKQSKIEHIKQFHPHLWHTYKAYLEACKRWQYVKPVQFFEESSLT